MDSEKGKDVRWFDLFSYTEGRILLVGLICGLCYVLWLTIESVVQPSLFSALGGMTVTHMLFGRAAGMSFGYAMGISQRVVLISNIWIESIVVLLFYPLFVLSWRHLFVFKPLHKYLQRIRAVAESHRVVIRKFGPVGLFIFVWFPLWMTGPLVGCVIGFLLGFHAWLTVAIVLGGTCVAVYGWAYFLFALHTHMTEYSPYAPLVFLCVLVVIVVVSHIIYQKGHHKE